MTVFDEMMGHSDALTSLPAIDSKTGLVHVVVEAPRGQRNKPKYDEQLGVFRVSKLLPLGFVFPFDFGFIPSTRGEDGDPLDVVIIGDDALPLGCLVGVRLLGAIEAMQIQGGKRERNDRLIGTVETPYNPPRFRSLAELGAARLREIEEFFVSYNALEKRRFEPTARRGPAAARRLVERGKRRFERAVRSEDGA